MFDNNWYLFLLIIITVFMGDDGLDRTEAMVLLGIIAALVCSMESTTNLDDIINNN